MIETGHVPVFSSPNVVHGNHLDLLIAGEPSLICTRALAVVALQRPNAQT
jgi:hypothetical protein